MSISKNVGALARYLTHLRTTTAYFDAKDNVRSFLDGVPLVGAPLKKNITECKTLLRRAMYHSTMFEDMGFQYIGRWMATTWKSWNAHCAPSATGKGHIFCT